jgi:integrase
MLTFLKGPMGRSDLTVHGFRSTFRDWAAEVSPYPRELAEAALAHVLGDKTEAAYQRGDLLEKRREMMQSWTDYLGSVSENKIVSLCHG